MNEQAMRTAVVINPRAGAASENAQLVKEQAQRFGWKLFETSGAGDAAHLARQAAEEGAARVIAAGGDGTVSQVVSGLMRSGARPIFGVVPLGTGNDFARTLQMPTDPVDACEWLSTTRGETGRTDLLEVRSERDHAWALNSVNGGIANEIRRCLDQEQKQRWGPWSFVLSGLEMAGSEVPSWTVELKLDQGPLRRLEEVVVVSVANAKSAGGGFQVAPSADIEDGRFDLVVISSERLTQLLNIAVRARLGLTFGSEHVEHALGTRLQVSAPEDFAFTVDGEPFRGREVQVALRQAALPFVAGPTYGEAES